MMTALMNVVREFWQLSLRCKFLILLMWIMDLSLMACVVGLVAFFSCAVIGCWSEAVSKLIVTMFTITITSFGVFAASLSLLIAGTFNEQEEIDNDN